MGTWNRQTISIIAVFCAILVSHSAALSLQYTAIPWTDEVPSVDPKVPVPIEPWQVSPLTALLVVTAFFLPVCLVPMEIFVSLSGFLVLNFRRIRRCIVLENDCRASIQDYIATHPGSGFTEIERGVPVNRGTLEYHLGILRRERLVVPFFREGRTYYFENASKFSPEEMEGIARLRNGSGYCICQYLLCSPDASRRDIAQKIKTTGSTVSWHMRRLVNARLVSTVKEGGRVRYRLTPVAREILGIVGSADGT